MLLAGAVPAIATALIAAKLTRLSRCYGSLALPGWSSGGSRYGSFSTALNRKDATAPFASSGAFGLMLHWPFFGPDVYLGRYPAK